MLMSLAHRLAKSGREPEEGPAEVTIPIESAPFEAGLMADRARGIVQIGRAMIAGEPIALLRRAGRIETLSSIIGSRGDRLEPLFANWPHVAATLTAAGPGQEVREDALGELLAPLDAPSKLVCIGTNYHDHVAEMGVTDLPKYPYALFKPATTIAPPGGPVTLPSMSRMVDWEAELGVVIGRRARHVRAGDALAYVAAYLPLNDVSARDWLDEQPSLGVDWVMQKAHDGFTPMGPWLTLAASIADPQQLPIRTLLNGTVVQDSSTANMIFPVAEIIAHLSAIMTLNPGDVIATGTPAGVGFARQPRLFIADGDVVTVDLGPLGALATRFVAEACD